MIILDNNLRRSPTYRPLREAIVMSMETCFGRELSVYSETSEHANRLILLSPVLSPAYYKALIGDTARYPFVSSHITNPKNTIWNPRWKLWLTL